MLFTVIAVGVLGYMFIDDYTFVDALFMTVITVSTVGFNIVDPLNPAAKVFTVFLIFSSIGTFMYAATIITKFIVDGQFLIQYKHNQVYKKISKLSGHVIVCGYGRNGRQAVQKLIDYNRSFVVIESDPERIARLSEMDNILFIEGNATEDEFLIKAGIERASHIITTLPRDSDNVFVVLSCRQFNKDLTIISRAADENSRGKLKIAGATNVIMPTKIGGEHMASLVVTPDVVEFLDNLSVDGKNHTNIKEVHIEDVTVEGEKATIRNFDLRRKTGVTVIGLKLGDGEYHVNPDGDIELFPGTKLIVLGQSFQIDKLEEMYGIK
ncbi:MAG: potassium channel protein [Flavobacteriales bacterium]|nr:potassium channel protein [Flavobacteriales bacterium]